VDRIQSLLASKTNDVRCWSNEVWWRSELKRRDERRKTWKEASEGRQGRRVIQGNKQRRREDLLCEEGKNGSAKAGGSESVNQPGSDELGQGRI
jgi:hypothetical protein